MTQSFFPVKEIPSHFDNRVHAEKPKRVQQFRGWSGGDDRQGKGGGGGCRRECGGRGWGLDLQGVG